VFFSSVNNKQNNNYNLGELVRRYEKAKHLVKQKGSAAAENKSQKKES
jgi:hypothetical protein